MMKKFFAIVTYKSQTNNAPTDNSLVEFSVLYFEDKNKENVEKRIRTMESCSYKNMDDDIVSWILEDILSIDEFSELNDGEEVTGFISDLDKS